MELVCAALLLLMLGTTAATPQDLGGKMFTFPQQTETDHVALKLNRTELGSLSVCMRVFSDLLRPHSLFVVSTNSSDQFYFIYNSPDESEYVFFHNKTVARFNHKNNYVINAWQTVCSTWDSATGLVQLWIDGKHSSRKFLSTRPITGPMTVILGQASVSRDSAIAGLFTFVGMLTDVHVWDYVLDPMVIRNYGRSSGFPRGNVLDWRSLDFEIHGRIFIE